MPPVGEPETWDEEWKDIRDDLAAAASSSPRTSDGPVGVARVEAPRTARARAPRATSSRARGGRASPRRCSRSAQPTRGQPAARRTSASTCCSRTTARIAVWRRLGFEELSVGMATPLDDARRAARRAAGRGVARDDARAEPTTSCRWSARSPSSSRGSSSRTSATNGSWIRVADPVLDRDREAHGRFARELSERLGAVTVALALEGAVVRFRLYERGRMVDEYLSVPTYYGELVEGRRARARREPDARRAPDGRRPRRGAARRAHRRVAGRRCRRRRSCTSSIARLMGLEP